jgi:hypothetical protein
VIWQSICSSPSDVQTVYHFSQLRVWQLISGIQGK